MAGSVRGCAWVNGPTVGEVQAPTALDVVGNRVEVELPLSYASSGLLRDGSERGHAELTIFRHGPAPPAALHPDATTGPLPPLHEFCIFPLPDTYLCSSRWGARKCQRKERRRRCELHGYPWWPQPRAAAAARQGREQARKRTEAVVEPRLPSTLGAELGGEGATGSLGLTPQHPWPGRQRLACKAYL